MGVVMDAVRREGATSFAAYLARFYVAKKGYAIGTVPEAAGLADSCDTILTCTDGYALKIVCIIDRETNPDRRFEVPRSHIELIGEQCLQYTGKVNGATMPVDIRVIEIGGGVLSQTDRDRLSALKGRGLYAKVQISGWHLDPSISSLWTNARFGGLLSGATGLRKLMRMPRAPEEELQPVSMALPPPVTPWTTYALLAILAGVFVAEQLFGIGPATGPLKPTIMTLVAMGGENSNLVVKAGEWHRVLSAPLLHGDAIHLLMNGVALYLGGSVLERLIGRAWFAALFVMGAIGGSLMSLAINPPNVISVGASGAIMALLAAASICSYRMPLGPERTTIQMNLARMLVPALIPLASSAHGQQVDFAAHFGGALTGGLVGLGLWRFWPASHPLPRFGRIAAAVAVAGLCAFSFSFTLVARSHHAYALGSQLIPSDQLPKTVADERAQAKGLVARYPHDPRAHMVLAGAYIEAKDYKLAEQELRMGLDESDILKTMFAPELEWQLRATLAQLIANRGDASEAKAVAQPVCVAQKASPMKEALEKVRLCE